MDKEQLKYVVERLADRIVELSEMAEKAPLSQLAQGELDGLNFAVTAIHQATESR